MSSRKLEDLHPIVSLEEARRRRENGEEFLAKKTKKGLI